MNKMNPIYPKQRGCFFDKRTEGKVIVVDYPTWASKNGRYVAGEMNQPIPDGQEYMVECKSFEEAHEFAAANNYVVCDDPWTKRVKFEKKPAHEDEPEA